MAFAVVSLWSTSLPFRHQQANAAVPVVAEPSVAREAVLEMHIANNGLVLLRDATVVSNADGVLRASMAWDDTAFTWTIQTTKDTKFISSEGEKVSSSAIAPGDIVTVTGMLASGERTITAKAIRK